MKYPIKCTKCGFVYSIQMSLKDYQRRQGSFFGPCPQCKSELTIRTYTTVNVIYKDSDFTKFTKEEQYVKEDS